jgi:cell fate (sporulation/competence/biofilm development) regulator YmcA (YheA/YmcA/DUF963 family)
VIALAEQAGHHHDGAHCTMERYTNTEMVVRADILVKAKELAELLSTSDEVQTYQKAEALINQNKQVQNLISAIKKKQKEIVGFEYFKNENMVKKIEAEITELQDQLDHIPIVGQFQQTQSDINYLLQLVMSVIKDTVSEKINVETGAAVPPSTCSD